MRFLDVILLLVLFLVLGAGLYVLWYNLPGEQVAYKPFSANISGLHFSNSSQFYPNMRYPDRVISYSISDSCSVRKRADVVQAFTILGDKTLLSFQEDSNAEIKVLCASVAPTPGDEGHFVAGEGGPTQIINTTTYSVILSGKVALYRSEVCDEPKVAIHEILHALGFDHNGNSGSIMYPVTDCSQQIDDYIVDEINDLYKVDSLPDLAISNIQANRTGRYLNFNIVVANFGLIDSNKSVLVLSSNGEEIKRFDLNQIEIGTKKIITVQDLRIPSDAKDILFYVDTQEQEISKDNNRVDISVAA